MEIFDVCVKQAVHQIPSTTTHKKRVIPREYSIGERKFISETASRRNLRKPASKPTLSMYEVEEEHLCQKRMRNLTSAELGA